MKESLNILPKNARRAILPVLLAGAAFGMSACRPQIIVVDGRPTPTPGAAAGVPTPDATDALLAELIAQGKANAEKPTPTAQPVATPAPVRVDVVVTQPVQPTPDVKPVIVPQPVYVIPGYPPYPGYPYPPEYPANPRFTTREIGGNWIRVLKNEVISGDIETDVGDGYGNRQLYDNNGQTGLVTQVGFDGMWVRAPWGASIATPLDNINDSYASGVLALNKAREMLRNGCGTGYGCPQGVVMSNGRDQTNVVRY